MSKETEKKKKRKEKKKNVDICQMQVKFDRKANVRQHISKIIRIVILRF